jgi:hypothetical protein
MLGRRDDRFSFRVDPGVSAGVHALAMADDEKRIATLSPSLTTARVTPAGSASGLLAISS